MCEKSSANIYIKYTEKRHFDFLIMLHLIENGIDGKQMVDSTSGKINNLLKTIYFQSNWDLPSIFTDTVTR